MVRGKCTIKVEPLSRFRQTYCVIKRSDAAAVVTGRAVPATLSDIIHLSILHCPVLILPQ